MHDGLPFVSRPSSSTTRDEIGQGFLTFSYIRLARAFIVATMGTWLADREREREREEMEEMTGRKEGC